MEVKKLEKPVVKVGDGVTVHGWSDAKAFMVERVSPTGHQIFLRRCKVRLLNGANSDAPDKMTCSVGGFAGHFEGQQRWVILPGGEEDQLIVANRRRSPKSGSWYNCQYGRVDLDGAHEYYDFNF